METSISDSAQQLYEQLLEHAPLRYTHELTHAVPSQHAELEDERPVQSLEPTRRSTNELLMKARYSPRGSYTGAQIVSARRDPPPRPQSASAAIPSTPRHPAFGTPSPRAHRKPPPSPRERVAVQGDWHEKSAAPPDVQVVLSRVVASSEALMVSIDEASTATELPAATPRAGHAAVAAAQRRAVEEHVNALIALRNKTVQEGRMLKLNLRSLEAENQKLKGDAAKLRTECSRLRWALTHNEVIDMKEDAIYALMAGTHQKVQKRHMHAQLASTMEITALHRQLEKASIESEKDAQRIAAMKSELDSVVEERNMLAALSATRDREIERLMQMLLHSNVQMESLTSEQQELLQRLEKTTLEKEGVESQLQKQMSVQRKIFNTASKAQEEKDAIEVRLQQAQPAGRLINVSNVTVSRVPDFDFSRGSGKSDPYLKLTLVDAHGERVLDEVQTHHFMNRTQATWTDTFRFFVPPEFSLPLAMQVDLWDKDWKTQDCHLADLRILLERERELVETTEMHPQHPKKNDISVPRPTVSFEYVASPPMYFV